MIKYLMESHFPMEKKSISLETDKCQNSKDSYKKHIITGQYKNDILIISEGEAEYPVRFIEIGPTGINGLYNIHYSESYNIILELGRIQFGDISLVETMDGTKCILKIINFSYVDEFHVRTEAYEKLLSYLDQSNYFVINMVNMYFEAHRNRVLIFLERAAFGSMRDIIHRLSARRLTEAVLGIVAIDSLRALEYLHARDVIHKDIKPDNLLMMAEGVCKLADFGVLTDDEYIIMYGRYSPYYVCYKAPERFDHSKPYNTQSDIWSLGLTFVELITGRFLYGELNDVQEVMDTILNGPVPQLTDEAFTIECRNLVNAMLVKEPAYRMSASDLLKMPFCKKFLTKEAEVRTVLVRWLRYNCK